MPTIDQQITELDRELRMRIKVYPRWINHGKISRKDADLRIEILSAAIQSLHELAEIKFGKQEKLKL